MTDSTTGTPTPPSMSPPPPHAFDPLDAPETSWPKVIGIISIVYASLGLMCGLGSVCWSLVVTTAALPAMMGGGAEMSGALRIYMIIALVAYTILGLVLLFGAINLVRRRRSGVKQLKGWAIARIIWVLVEIGAGVALLDANVQFQRSMQEKQIEAMGAQGVQGNPMAGMDEATTRQFTLVMTVVAAGLKIAYPLFLGFFLARTKVTEEVERWP